MSHFCGYFHDHLFIWRMGLINVVHDPPPHTSLHLHLQAYTSTYKPTPPPTSLHLRLHLHLQAYTSTYKPTPPPTSLQLHLQAYTSTYKPTPPPTSLHLHLQAYNSTYKPTPPPISLHLHLQAYTSTYKPTPSPTSLSCTAFLSSVTVTINSYAVTVDISGLKIFHLFVITKNDETKIMFWQMKYRLCCRTQNKGSNTSNAKWNT